VLNNLLLVTLVEEALFRGYIQGGLSQRLKHLPYGENLALLLASLLFGLAHLSAGWQWVAAGQHRRGLVMALLIVLAAWVRQLPRISA